MRPSVEDQARALETSDSSADERGVHDERQGRDDRHLWPGRDFCRVAPNRR
jgi:hypothetical protein